MQKYPTTYRTTLLFALMICYLVTCLISSCSETERKKPLDTKGVKISYKSVRYDQLFFSIDPKHVYKEIDRLGRKYPDFTKLYLSTLAGFGEIGTPQFDTAIHQFLTLKDYRNLYDTVQKHFSHIERIDQELEITFKNIKYFFPEENYEQVYYFISGLNLWSAITIDSAVGVGLDMYLGPDFPFYSSVQIPAYEALDRTQNRIAIEVAKAIFQAKFPYTYEGKSLLDMMLYKGKELYFCEQVCRTKKDALIIGYTPEQTAFCDKNEEGIYYFFVKQKLLYSTTWQDIMPLVNDGPNTVGMPEEAPGNIGSWLGWQMVRKYMQEHPNESMKQLMENKLPAQQFLRAAKYKP